MNKRMGSWLWEIVVVGLSSSTSYYILVIIFLDWNFMCVKFMWTISWDFSSVAHNVRCVCVCVLNVCECWQLLCRNYVNSCSINVHSFTMWNSKMKKTRHDLLQTHLKLWDEIIICLHFVLPSFNSLFSSTEKKKIECSMCIAHGYNNYTYWIHPFWLNVNYGCNCRFGLMRPYSKAFDWTKLNRLITHLEF